MNERPGIYVHIPFCQRKCYYCDFVSYPLDKGYSDVIERYLVALLREIPLRRSWLNKAQGASSSYVFHSLYIGGGTPSILSVEQIGRLMEVIRRCLPLSEEAEITLEANPGTIDAGELRALRQIGVNRLSLGVQSFDDVFLARLGRLHNVNDVLRVVEEARMAGFRDLSFDLMLGLPGQDLAAWQETLARAVKLRPEHISCYELTIEPDTVYGQWYRQGKITLPIEDTVISMLEWTGQYLADHGYEHYEISNYALPGYKARHNLIYWQNRWYLGLGAGAYSYWQGRRWGNTYQLEKYHDLIAIDELPEEEEEILDLRGQAGETMMLGLRLLEGVSLAEFRARFGISMWELWPEDIDGFLAQGLLELDRGRLRLSSRGLLLANQVLCAFVGSS